MKSKSLLLFAAFGCVLASCQLTKPATYRSDALTKQTVSAYDLATMASKGSTSADAYKLNDVDLYFASEFEGAPYMSLAGYGKLLSNYLLPGFKHQITSSLTAESLVLSNENNEPVYQLIVDYSKSTFLYAGEASAALTSLVDYSRTSLFLQAEIASSVAAQGTTTGTKEYFGEGKLPTYKNNGVFYLPLALWDARIGSSAGVTHFYSGSMLYRYEGAAQLVNKFSIGNRSVVASEGWGAYYQNHGRMPKGLAYADADVFYFKMSNEYGLRSRKLGSKGFATYLKEKNIDNNGQIGSQNPIAHAQAIVNALNILDDDHTGVSSVAPWWGQGAGALTSQRGPNSVSRNQTLKTLTQKRKAVLDGEGLTEKDVRISADQSLAVINFNAFNFAMEAYVPGTRELSPDIADQDTFFYLQKQFQTIKANKSITKVVLDMSLNGGGTIGVLYKILAYISPSNSAKGFLQRGTVGTVQMTTRVDTNNDGRYTVDDVVGHSYKIYLLLSDASFSCGNALPFFAKKQNFVTIVGQKSGGGECSVSSVSLPSGIIALFSSTTHSGWYDNGNFEGCEDGVVPDISLTFDEFYSLQSLQSKLID